MLRLALLNSHKALETIGSYARPHSPLGYMKSSCGNALFSGWNRASQLRQIAPQSLHDVCVSVRSQEAVGSVCWFRYLLRSVGLTGVFIAEIRELSVNNEHRCVHTRKVNAFLSFSRSHLSSLSLGGHTSHVGIRYCMEGAWMLDVCFIGTSHHFSYHTS